jgi:hypothetical protein
MQNSATFYAKISWLTQPLSSGLNKGCGVGGGGARYNRDKIRSVAALRKICFHGILTLFYADLGIVFLTCDGSSNMEFFLWFLK